MTTNITNEVLQLDEHSMKDDSIEKIEFQEVVINDIDARNTLNFIIDYTDQWILPCEAYIQFTGKIVKNDGTAYAAAANIAFTNNGIMNYFRTARYMINNQDIEVVENPGEASLVMGLVDYSEDYAKMMGDQICFHVDGPTTTAEAANLGFASRKAMTWIEGTGHRFDFCIPLSHIYRFAKDVRKVFYGMTHNIELIKGNVNDAIMRAAAADAGKVTLTGASLWYPRVTPSLKEQAKLTKWIASSKQMNHLYQQVKHYSVNFVQAMTNPTWNITNYTGTSDRPRHVFITFQTVVKQNNQEQNNSVFDAMALTDISLYANNERLPYTPHKVDYANNQYGRVYRDLLNYRGVDNDYDGGMLITKKSFKAQYPIYHFDLEQSKEPLNNTTSLLQMKATLAPTGDYRAIAVILSDRELTFKADGKQMTLIYK